MTLPNGWLVEQRLRAAQVKEDDRLASPDAVEAFRLSVQFTRAHGVRPGIPGTEITTLCSGYRLLSEPS